MKRGRGKVEFEDLAVGAGPAASREHKARVSITMRLHRGDLVRSIRDYWIDLKRRDHAVAGVHYGIEGMQVGGKRRIIVPPHLGYREKGAPGGGIPPNALLVCEVELLELQPTDPISPKLALARKRKSMGEKRPQ